MKFIIFAIITLAFNFLSAQNPDVIKRLSTDKEKGNTIKKILKTEEKLKKDRINVYLLNNPNDQKYENKIYDVVEGKPIYLENFDNRNASIGTRTNFLQLNGKLDLNLEGEGLNVGIWEVGQMAKNDHIEFLNGNNRIQNLDSEFDPGTHATHVTGTILAEGINPRAKGMAPKSKGFIFDTNNDRIEVAELAQDSLLLVSNHSYGIPLVNNDGVQNPASIFGTYSNDARSWDRIINDFPYLLSVHSAGNSGATEASNPSVTGGDKLASAKVSKNTLTVGSANFEEVNSRFDENNEIVRPRFGSFSVISNFSSQGPTDDLRIKPDLIGIGERVYSTNVLEVDGVFVDNYIFLQGTSMSAPNVSGTALLLQELYFNLNNTFMKSATIKGLLCTTASDVGRLGPDIVNGWGLVNAKKAAKAILNNGEKSLIVEQILNETDNIYTVEFTKTESFSTDVGLSWNDPAGNATTNTNDPTPKLVNDLDLKIIGPNNEEYLPWKLDEENPINNALKGNNNRDNVEIINIVDADPGKYKIMINYKGQLALNNQTREQEFSLIITNFDQISLSNQDFEKNSIKFWPNPVKNNLNISSSEMSFSNDTKVGIYDMTGREVMRLDNFNPDSNLSIDVSSLSKGIYILNLTDGGQSIQKRIIKE